MAPSGDLIDFDIIEAQKENIQAIPSGRSAKKLVEGFSASPLHKLSTPTPTDTQNVNDCIRAEYEAEVENMSESDDPLDVFDRYVRWTLDAYPSSQATPQSQLHTLLERATKTFINSPQYKNDPRYLKLWMLYIQLFADAPRETFLFLSRHNVGEGLALFYEEYAAWLEGAGRWSQAEEVYKLGIEREARPQLRLMRKLKEFEQRRAQLPDLPDEPSSPALPTVRPALAAKVDPFAAARAAAADPQAPRQTSGVGGPASKPGKAKMTIFSDADAQPPALSARDRKSKGWDTIDSLANRKKENVRGPTPWVGETLKAGGKKNDGPKMQVFRDTSQSQSESQSQSQSRLRARSQAQLAKSHITLIPSNVQVVVNPVSGKKERIFVNLEAVYPDPEVPGSELSFEEIWAMNRGWLDQSWEPEVTEPSVADLGDMVSEKLVVHTETVMLDENGNIMKKSNKPRKMKTMEINETQIIKANLDSPSKPRPKRRTNNEPTMTLHTKAATDEIYDIFNQPLQPPRADEDESADDDDDYETDGDYTSGVDSTVTTTRHIDVDDEAGNEETSDAKSVSEWSDFSTRRHVPDINAENDDAHEEPNDTRVSDLIDVHDAEPSGSLPEEYTETQGTAQEEEEEQDDDDDRQPRTRTIYVPIPPEDYEPRTRPYRDPAEVANNRLPFMTPITERTETSLGMLTTKKEDLYDSPIQRDEEYIITEEEEEEDEHVESDQLASSPVRDVVDDARPAKVALPVLSKLKSGPAAAQRFPPKGPIIKELQCNPMDDAVRDEILAAIHPPLSSYPGFYDHRQEKYEKGGEIRRYAKAMTKPRSSSDRSSNPVVPPVIEFPDVPAKYTIRKELGAGAFAPVYLVENSNPDGDNEQDEDGIVAMGKGAFATRPRSRLEALKMEDPPSAWEFHMLRLAHSRLGPQHRATASLTNALELHLYRDECFLLLPFHPHGSLLDVVNLFRAEPSGVMDEQLAMFFTVELLRTVEALHRHSILHGDLKPDNCLVRLDHLAAADTQPLASQYRADGSGGWAARGVQLIDMGRGIDMRNFSPEVQFVADWKTSAQDCAEMREGRPWTWQIDYHGLAGIVYCLLFGRYIETVRCDQGGLGRTGRRYRIRESLKRYWQTDLWGSCFELLLNPASFLEEQGGAGKTMPVVEEMKGVRMRMEAWLEANCEKGVGLRSLVGRVEAYARSRR